MKYTIVKGTLFFPLGGFFNEVTQIKRKEVEENYVSAFPSHNVRSKIKETKVKESRHR